MFKAIKAVAMSAVLGAGLLAAVPASADGVRLGFSSGHNGGIYLDIRDGDRRGGWDRGRHRGCDGGRDRGPRHVCTPHRAVDKARAMGLRRAHVTGVTHRSIRVSGHRWGDWRSIVFARAPHCPVIR